MKRKPKRASPQQRKYVKGRLAGKTKKRAALDAGYAVSTAENAKQKIEIRPEVRRLFAELLEQAGVTNEFLQQRVLEGLHATVVSKQTQYANREVLVDFSERREMLELIFKLQGLLKNKIELGGPSGGPIPTDINITVKYVKPERRDPDPRSV